MWLATLAIVAILGQNTEIEPDALVNHLGASRFADRKAAEDKLEQIGRRALPALQKGLNAKDLEVRTRSSALINRIETGLLTKASAISLDVDNATLGELAESISEQSGMRIRINPENPRGPQAPRVSIHEPKPLPFWKAIDRVCREGQLAYTMTNGAAGRSEQGLLLMKANSIPTAPVFDSGPFRLTLLGFHYQRDLSFTPAPLSPNPAVEMNRPLTRTSESFFAQIQIAAEPRLGLAQLGQVKILEATDEKGQSLRVEPAPGASGRQQVSGYFGMSSGSTVTLQAVMTHPPTIGKTLKKLKGVIPVSVSTRKPSPLVIALNAAAETTVKNDQTELTLHEAKVQPTDRPQTVQVTIHSNEPEDSETTLQPGIRIRTRDPLQKIEVADSKGELIPSFVGFVSPETGRLTITLSPRNGSIPKELRYFETARTSTELNFEFSDVPMP